MPRSWLSALAGTILATITPSPAPAQDCAGTAFWAAESLEARESPREAVIGDFNADGLADLAVAKYNLNSVQVSLRQPSGAYTSFSYGTAQGVGFQPDDLASGDIDGDSDLDLVVVNSFDRTFTVLKNGGTGLFTVSETRALGFSFGDLALGDLDGDGDLDLVSVGSGTSREFSVFLNTAGSFAWSRDYTVAGVPGSLVLAHLDSDSFLDVAVASADDGSVSILWNTGTGGVLSAPVRLATFAQPAALAAGDVDGDGRPDLLTAHAALGQVGVLANQGGRNFAPVRAVATGVRTATLALGDVDQDGDLDLAVTGSEVTIGVAAGASILLNSGTGAFATAQRFDVGESPLSIAFGDLDGDGDADVVVTDQGSDDLRLFINRGARVAAGWRTQFAGGSGVEGIAHGDLNGDGRPELVVAQRTQVQVLAQVGAGAFAPPATYPAGTSVRDVAVGDVDGDGDADVVVVDDATDDFGVLLNSGGVLAAPLRLPACADPWAIVLSDMDADLDLDAVVACSSTGIVRVFKNDGTGHFPTSVGVGFGASAFPFGLAVGDMDGDGDRDFVAGVNNSNLVAVGRNDGAFFSQGWSDGGCNTPESVAVADVNGDGRLDIAASCRLGARVRIYLNAGGGTFTLGETPLVINPLNLKLADMDGDGDADLVVVRGNTRGVAVFANDGSGHFAPSRDVAADADAWPLDVVDWDGDGDLDLATGSFSYPRSTAMLNTGVGCPASATLAVSGGSVAEGDAGATPLTFGVTLSTPVPWPVTVDYQTASGTASAGSDFEATGGTVTFAPGEVQKAVAVNVFGDTQVEPDESFWLDLSAAVGAPIETAQAGGTIVNDDDGSATALLALDLTSVENGAGFVRPAPVPDACVVEAGQSMHCEYEFSTQDIVALIPEARPGSKFMGWTGACTGTGSCVLPMSEAREVGASFLGPRTLTVQLTSVEGGRGRVDLSPPPLGPVSACDNLGQPDVFVCTFQYPPDTVVTLSRFAYPDSKFMIWSGGCSGTGPCDVPLAGPGPGPVVDASFLGPRTLTVQLTSVEGGRGRVDLSPPPLGPVSACDNLGQPDVFVCTFQYPPDTVVTLSRFAYPDSKFMIWSGGCSGTGPCDVPLAGPGPGPVVDASFLGPRTLTVQLTSVEGGRGRVDLSPPPLGPVSACDNLGQPDVFVCTFQYPPDTVVTLSRFAYPDSKFMIWSGACSGTGPCDVPLAGPGPGPVVDASFLGPRTLTVQLTSVEGGRGRVDLSPPPLGPTSACDNLGQPDVFVCTFQYPPDTVVTLSRFAYPDSKFLIWSGACSGTGPCDVPLAGPGPGPMVDASFLGPRPLALAIASSRGGRGSLAVDPVSLQGEASCPLPPGATSTACTLLYGPDTAVTVTAIPEPGSVVRDFGGSCPPTGPCTITMSGPASVSAVFEVPNRAPAANAGGPYAGVRGQAIVFNGAGSSDPDGDPLSYVWDFGDGGTGTGVSPSHAYASLGSFVVTLVVSDGTLTSPPATASVTISNLAPAVTLTAPADGSTHPASAPIALAADALDADGLVVRVDFYAGAVKVGEAVAPPFTASWTGMAPGDYVLTAQATDDSGAVTTSAPRLVHVNPSPVVALTAPAAGATFVAPANLVLAATASDDGAVAAVEFYQGTTLLGVDTTSPYTFNWSNVPAGRYVLTARAIDDAGGATVSAPVTIDVVTVVAAAADSYVRDGGNASNNFGSATAVEVRVAGSGQNRWTYLRFNIGSLSTIQAAKLRLFGNLTSTTTTAVQARVFSSTNLTWGEGSITWNNKPAPGATVLATVPLVINSTTARWYEWDLTAFLQAEKAAGHTAVTLVLRNDVATPNTTFRSRQASSNRPELRITP